MATVHCAQPAMRNRKKKNGMGVNITVRSEAAHRIVEQSKCAEGSLEGHLTSCPAKPPPPANPKSWFHEEIENGDVCTR